MSSIPSDLRRALSSDAALQLEDWIADPYHESIVPRLLFLIANRPREIIDSFSRTLTVGTGGMRAAVGLGPGRFNQETLGRAVQGHANLLRRRHAELFASGNEPPIIVIAHDVRCFHDRRGIYKGFTEADALTGVTSRDFASFAAVGYALAGFRVLLPGEDAPYISTPELSFTIRSGGFLGGINISASHNHPDDNGVKFYGADGAQLAGAIADELELEIKSADLPDPVADDDADLAMARISELAASFHDAYLENAVRGFTPRDGGSIVFTPLGGVGADSVTPALQRACPGVHICGGAGDGSFSEVPFGLPNPEITEVFAPALRQAEAVGATMVLASDPDADRLGAALRRGQGEWVFLTGNQIGSILLEWLCAREPATGAQLALVQTCVTGEETVRIAESHGLTIASDLPVGFKFIARAVDALAKQGRRVVLAFEESIGYLRSNALREKDAAGAAVALAHAHLEQLAAGSSLLDYYERLNARHGHHVSTTRSLVMTGDEGLATQQRILDGIRSARGVPGIGLELTRDHEREPCTLIDLSAAGDRRALDVLELRGRVEGVTTRLAARKSGTEPKIKLYFEISGDADAHIDDITFAGLRAILEIVDLPYSRVSHALPDHIPLIEKRAFETKIGPEFLALAARAGKFTATPGLSDFARHFKGASLDSLFDALWRLGGHDLDLAELDDFLKGMATPQA